MRGSVGSVSGGLSGGQPSQGVGSAVMCGMWGSQRVGLAAMCGDMHHTWLTVFAPEDGRSSRGCAGAWPAWQGSGNWRTELTGMCAGRGQRGRGQGTEQS